jgi:hypothetical protein
MARAITRITPEADLLLAKLSVKELFQSWKRAQNELQTIFATEIQRRGCTILSKGRADRGWFEHEPQLVNSFMIAWGEFSSFDLLQRITKKHLLERILQRLERNDAIAVREGDRELSAYYRDGLATLLILWEVNAIQAVAGAPSKYDFRVVPGQSEDL